MLEETGFSINPYYATDLFWIPEVFWCFQGVSKEISGTKWVKIFFEILVSNMMAHVPIYIIS